MASDTDLNIRIRIMAEQQGVQLTEEAIQKIQERTEELAQSSDKAAEASAGVTDEMKAQAQAAVDQINADEGAAEASGHLGHESGSLREELRGLHEVFRGLETGNPVEVFRGLVNVVKGLGVEIATVARALVGLLPGIALVAAPVLAAIAAMKLAASEARAEMESWWAAAVAGAEKYKQKSAEVKAASEADLKAMTADVDRLKASYVSLIAQMDEATKRSHELVAAQNELNLALAKTDEEKKAINITNGVTMTQNDILNADLKARNTADLATQARENIRGAQTTVDRAQIDFENAKNVTENFAPDDPTGAEARKAALLARQKLDEANANLDKITTANNAIIADADKAAADARLAHDVGAIKLKTADVTAKTLITTAAKTDATKEADLRAKATAAEAIGDNATQDAAVAELAKMAKAASDLNKQLKSTAVVTTAALTDATKQAQQNAVQIISVTEGGLGGGG